MIITAQVTPGARRRAAERFRRDLQSRTKRRHRLYNVRDVVRLAGEGMGRGFVQKSLTTGEWDLAPTCESPVPVPMDGAPCRLSHGRFKRTYDVRPFSLLLWTKCRKCRDCLRRRRNLWGYRAQNEIQRGVRTWFATFTFTPVNHSHLRARASQRLTNGGSDLDMLPDREVFAELLVEYGAEITKYFKRIRKNTGCDLRYICVPERHKSGLVHFHALIHEGSPDRPLRHAALTASWKLGFTKFKLVEGLKSAWYVAKYLTKDVGARVRASIAYGSEANRESSAVLKPSRAQRERVNKAPPTPLKVLGFNQTSDCVSKANTEETRGNESDKSQISRQSASPPGGTASPRAVAAAPSARAIAIREAVDAAHAISAAFRISTSAWRWCATGKPCFAGLK